MDSEWQDKIPLNVRVEGLEPQVNYTFRVRAENDFEDNNQRFSPWVTVNNDTLGEYCTMEICGRSATWVVVIPICRLAALSFVTINLSYDSVIVFIGLW